MTPPPEESTLDTRNAILDILGQVNTDGSTNYVVWSTLSDWTDEIMELIQEREIKLLEEILHFKKGEDVSTETISRKVTDMLNQLKKESK